MRESTQGVLMSIPSIQLLVLIQDEVASAALAALTSELTLVLQALPSQWRQKASIPILRERYHFPTLNPTNSFPIYVSPVNSADTGKV